MKLNPDITISIIDKNHKRETLFSSKATKNSDYLRREQRKPESHIRLPFSRDADRILHSMAYTRYIDKTQVFYLVNNDHITHRVLHVQLVSKIAKTIGRALGLNEDLIEAISLGHDIGHVPCGHVGEKILSKLCEKHNVGKFFHNVQAIQFLDVIEDKDLTIQVLDGILCHNGEVHDKCIKPEGKRDWDSFDDKVKKIQAEKDVMPMSYEGCVVRFADNIAYLGRDLQDAIEIGLITDDIKQKYPKICKDLFRLSSCKEVNWIILDTLAKDIINNSYPDEKDEISFSDELAQCVNELKKFNKEYIYNNRILHEQDWKIEYMFEFLFNCFLKDVEEENKQSVIFKNMIEPEWISEEYKKSVKPAELVRDYLAGMTDRYFNNVFRSLVIPNDIVTDFNTRVELHGIGGSS